MLEIRSEVTCVRQEYKTEHQTSQIYPKKRCWMGILFVFLINRCGTRAELPP